MPTSPQVAEAVAGTGGAARPRFMVPVDGRRASAGVIRETSRIAQAQGAPWLAVYLDASRRLHYSRLEERRLSANLRLVDQLGGDLVCFLPSERYLGRDLLALAKARGVTHLVLGHSDRPRWLDRLRGSLLEDLAQGDHDLVIHVVRPRPSASESVLPPVDAEPLDPRNLAIAIGIVACTTAVGYLVFRYLGLADVFMLYMLAIAVAATRFGRWTTLLTSILSILTLDFCFIEPRYSFVLTDIQHTGTFAVMLGVGWVILGLAERIRTQARLAQDRERHTRALYNVGKVLAEGGSAAAIQRRVEEHLRQELEVPLELLLCDPKGRLPAPADADLRLTPEELELARKAMELGAPVGRGTGTSPGSRCLMLPMTGTERPVGVLALLPVPGLAALEPHRLGLLVPLASQVSLALERAALAEERAEARIRAEHEHLRSTLLSSISHDLRTPLGTITGATTTLLDPGPQAAPGDQAVLLNTIHHESRRLLRMVNNLLDITRLESRQVQVQKEWAAIEEVVGSALSHLEEQLGSRPVSVDLPELWVPMDPVLVEQALVNLLDNALKFSPPGSAIALRGWSEAREFRILVADQGPGIPAGEEELIFEKLYRGTGGALAPGAGLGLAICRSIAQAHGGTILARNGPRGGAEIILSLPLEGSPLDGMPAEPHPDSTP